MQVENTLSSKHHPPFKNFKIFSNEFLSKLAKGMRRDPNIYQMNSSFMATLVQQVYVSDLPKHAHAWKQ
jgi:hypothetical protein